jgi:hypothetical protein
MCLSSETLVDMRNQFFRFKNQRIDLVSCFNYCNQIKIDNEQDAKICESCQPKLEMEYDSKFLKKEASITEPSIIPIAQIKEEQELDFIGIQNDTTMTYDSEVMANEIVVSKAGIKTEAVTYQISFPVHGVKEEPELQINVASDIPG